MTTERWIDQAKREFSIQPPADTSEPALGNRMLNIGDKQLDINIKPRLARLCIVLKLTDFSFAHEVADYCIAFNHTIAGLPRAQAIEAARAEAGPGIMDFEKSKKPGFFKRL